MLKTNATPPVGALKTCAPCSTACSPRSKTCRRICARPSPKSVQLQKRGLSYNQHRGVDQRVDNRLLGDIHTTAGLGQHQPPVLVADGVEIPKRNHHAAEL